MQFHNRAGTVLPTGADGGQKRDFGGEPARSVPSPLKKPFRETDPASTRENGDYSRRKAPRRRKSEAARAPTDRGLPPTLVSSAQPWAGGFTQ